MRKHFLSFHGGLIGGLAVVALAVAACSSSGGASSAPPSLATSPSAAAASGGMQVMGSGTFHDVDGSASGTAELVVTPSGAYEVVFEEFQTGSTAHTNVVLVMNTDVTATADVDKSKLLDLGPLKGTEGMQEYTIPADMAGSVMEGYHTVLIWDTEMAHAIAAAPLQ